MTLLEYCYTGWLCFIASHRQRGHLETAPPFTVSCDERVAPFLHRSHRELNPGLSPGSPLHNRCAMPAPPCHTGMSCLNSTSSHIIELTCYFHTLGLIHLRNPIQHLPHSVELYNNASTVESSKSRLETFHPLSHKHGSLKDQEIQVNQNYHTIPLDCIKSFVRYQS